MAKSQTSKSLSRSDLKLLKSLGENWLLTPNSKKLSTKVQFANYLDAFMFVTRITVHAEVLKIYPQICLDKHDVAITFINNPVATDDLNFAKKINELISTVR